MTRIVIDYDPETHRATIAVDDRPAQVWKDCDARWSKTLNTTEVDGWIKHEPTTERSFTLYGTRTV